MLISGPDPEPARVARTSPRADIAQAFPLLADAPFDCIGAHNAFEDNLNRSVHAKRLFGGGRRHDGTELKIEFVRVF
jgi:hypothetical protein